MDALLTITVFFLSSVIWNEWKVVVVEVREKLKLLVLEVAEVVDVEVRVEGEADEE